MKMNTFDKLAFFEVNKQSLNHSYIVSSKDETAKKNVLTQQRLHSPTKKECYSNVSFNYTNTTINSPKLSLISKSKERKSQVGCDNLKTKT